MISGPENDTNPAMSSLSCALSKPSVVVVGACNVDLITYTKRFPLPGETITGSHFKQGWGGKGANQAVMVSFLSESPDYVAMVGKVGDDSFGKDTIANFKQKSVNADFMYIAEGVSSGLAPITVSTDTGENQIVIIPGANDKITVPEITAASDIIKGAKYLVCQLELQPLISVAAMKIAKTFGVSTILNPAPAQTIAALPSDIFQYCDFVAPNQTELSLLTGGMPTNTIEEVTSAARFLLSQPSFASNPSCRVLVTVGALGSLLVTGSSSFHAPSPPCPGPVVDTVGAGDSFLGALAFYLSKGCPVEEAMKFANVVAGWSVTREGTQTSYPRRADLPKEMQM